MTDRLNYATHAIEDIQKQLDHFKIDEPLVAWTLDHLVSAAKFILPDRGELLDLTNFNQQHADLIKLPYPVTLIEAPFPPPPRTAASRYQRCFVEADWPLRRNVFGRGIA
ncbi:hypothetical protein [Sphingomonas sp. Ant20]|uniref:hypothetical protein n=1 Tax=Sphingomonas sp. Ant20 TaxID=104605 RepID=UPI000FE14B23|nr:hypothetical protein [Sphingomonas sp. Ant20]